jgi:hypothetical protein
MIALVTADAAFDTEADLEKPQEVDTLGTLEDGAGVETEAVVAESTGA